MRTAQKVLEFISRSPGTGHVAVGASKELMRGLRFQRNRNNPFAVLWLHYTADPERDPERLGAEWFRQKVREMGGINSSGWRREYEIDFEAQAGQRVFEQFDPRRHVVGVRTLPQWYNRYVVIDYGLRNPTAILWLAYGEGQHFIEAEYFQAGASVRESAQAFHLISRELHAPDELKREVRLNDKTGELENRPALEEWQGRFYDDMLIDPSTIARNEAETKTILERFAEHGVYPGLANRAVDGLKIANDWFARDKLYVMARCVNTIREVQNLVWAEHADLTLNYREKERDRNNHTTDCLKYYANLFPTEGDEPDPPTRSDPLAEDTRVRELMEEARYAEEHSVLFPSLGPGW